MAGNGKTKGASRGKRAKRSGGEAMTGQKAGAVETRTAAKPGELDLPKPNDWDYHRKTITGYREQVTTANGRVRNAVKAAKAAGIDMEAMNKAIAAEREADPVKLQTYLEQLSLGLKQSGSTILLSVHDTLAGDVQKQAYERGLADAKAGRMANNPYPELSDLAGQYGKGFTHGTADNAGVSRADLDKEDEAFAAGEPMPEGSGPVVVEEPKAAAA